jgi:hypothetical protein
MEWLTNFLALSAGIFLRLAVPIGVTALAVYALRRLDARWQADAESYVETASPGATAPACWVLKDCPPASRRLCPVPNAKSPCWQVRRRPNGDLLTACLTCEVFLAAPLLRVHAPA